MATFEIIEGRPGQGKSLYTARLARKLILRNKKFFKRTGTVRPVVSNIKFSENFEAQHEGFIKYWTSTEDIVKLKDCDLLWDEIATELDSRSFSSLSEDLKRFLSQYRKRGVDIYANTQDFSMIDMRARLMVTRVATIFKILGSRDPSPTKPPIRYIWGLVIISEVTSFLSDDPHKKKRSLFGHSFFFIEKQDIEIYNTRQDVPKSPPLPIKKHYTEIKYFDGPNDGKSEHKYM